jgi:hypothetical protein
VCVDEEETNVTARICYIIYTGWQALGSSAPFSVFMVLLTCLRFIIVADTLGSVSLATNGV